MVSPQEDSFMDKSLRTVLIVFTAVVLVVCSFGGGFVTARLLPIAQPTLGSGNPPSNGTPGAGQTDLQTLFAPFWQAWTLVHQDYVSQPVDDTQLMQGAIKGMMTSLTTGLNYYMTPDEYQSSQQQLNGENYTGIGVWVDTSGEYLTVVRPMKGSPGEKAGLQSGDEVIAIDGQSMTGITPEVARTKILGPEGTTVTLKVLRKSEQRTFEVTITRASINPPLVDYRMLDNNIAYVNLLTFGDTADRDLQNALKELLAQKPKGLILDLRFNTGGYLDQGVAVASEFLSPDQIVVYEKSGNGNLTPHKSLGSGIATDIPMVVLVNEWSASASEIVAGALQDYGRAKLVGVTTFGKGSVQSIIPLDNNQGVLGITIAQWLTPKQRLIQGTGLTTDLTAADPTQADAAAGKDAQLDAAVKALLNP
jgi:carboxyl-terminal processing protease